MKTRPKVIGYAGAALGLAAILYVAFRPAAIMVESGVVLTGPMQVAVEEQGETRSHDRFVVGAPVSGRLLRVVHHAGDAIEANAVVATIAPVPLGARERDELRAREVAALAALRSSQAQLDHVVADLAQARRESERLEQLFARQLVARQAMEQAQNEAETLEREAEAARFRTESAAAELREVQAGLTALNPEYASGTVVEIRAPAAGRILRILETSERVLAAGTPILVIGDLQQLEVVMEVLSSEAVRLTPGMPALLDGWGGDGPLRAKVRTIEPYAFTKVSALGVEEKRTNVVLDFVDPPGALGDGYRVNGRIITWEAQDVLKVPVSALFRCESGWCVFVVDGKRAREAPVTLGHINSAEGEILSGLRAGQRVIRHPPNALAEGMRVRLLK
jgi:HlyD family secretion protein